MKSETTIKHPVWALWPRERNYLPESAPRRRGLYYIISSLLNLAKRVPCVCARAHKPIKKAEGSGSGSTSSSEGLHGCLNSSSRGQSSSVAVPVVFVSKNNQAPWCSLGSRRELVNMADALELPGEMPCEDRNPGPGTGVLEKVDLSGPTSMGI